MNFFSPFQVTISLAFSIIAILGTIVGAIIFCRTLAMHPYHYMMYRDRFSFNETEAAMEHYVSYLQQKICG